MNEEQMNEAEMQVREANLRVEQERTQNMQQEIMLNQQDKNIIQDQLDLGEELERIDFLLRGYALEKDPKTGERKWIPPVNQDMIILSDYGVHLVRNTIAWYLNKNTLLSNYDDDTIRQKMEDFASDLNDTVFMEYEKVFQYPTFEDCKDLLKERIENKKKMRIFAKEILGKKMTEEEKERIEADLLAQIEPILERELEKIKQQIMKEKLKRFMIIIREIQDAVHSTYNRAFGGQERRTLREHIHVSETTGQQPLLQQQKGGMFDFMKRK